MGDLGKFAHFTVDYENVWAIGPNKDTVDALWRMGTQSINMEIIYQKARPFNPEYADRLYNEWLAGGHDPSLVNAFQQVIDVGTVPQPPTPPPITQPGSWVAPVTSGMVCRIPSQFFMSGMRTPNGLLLGTYRPAKLYLYDGAFHDEISDPWESYYMLHMPPDGQPLVSTECPAQVFKRRSAGNYDRVMYRDEPKSLAFDILPYRDGLLLFTVDRVNSHNIRMYKGDVNGNGWSTLRDHTGHFKQCCTDGQTYWLVGEKDGFPYIVHENGSQVMLDKNYKGQEINYASVKNGLFTLGLNNITDIIEHDGKRRNGYVNHFDGKNDIAGIDCRPPWIMQTEAVPEGRFAVASIWNESGYPNPELVWSKDGRTGWKKIADIPMPSVQTIEIADGGVYCYGGAIHQYGACYFHKV